MDHVTVEQALGSILSHTDTITDTEDIPLSQTPKRILAKDIEAPFDYPPFDRSLIDGYACKAADIADASQEHPARLEVIREIDAGQYSPERSEQGQAVRIMTGAAIPPGCDCCVRQEDTDQGEKQVRIYHPEKPRGNCGLKGEDLKKGEKLLKRSTRLGPVEAGILADMGYATAPVYRLPRAVVFTTGDELILPGQPLPPGKIYNSNQTFLTLRLLELGVQIVYAKSIPDDPRVMAEALKRASQDADLILSTGAVSMGKKDIMDEALTQLRAEKIFWRILARPGMPTRFSVYDGVPILSLSGSPSGVAVMTEILARPMIQKMKQDDSLEPVRVQGRLANAPEQMGKMRRFVYASWHQGVFHLPEGRHAARSLTSIVGCDCLIDLRPDPETLKPKELLEAILL